MPVHKSAIRLVLEPLVLAVALALLARTVIHIYAIPSDSMVPTLAVGDHILVTAYGGALPSRGDVVVFRSKQSSELLVKRIIALPGDLIESRLGRVVIGGHTLAERYLAEPAASGTIERQIVPAGCYFVLGDNRARSIDSRKWGVVARSQIVGRARIVLWSSGPDTPGLRLFRAIE